MSSIIYVVVALAAVVAAVAVLASRLKIAPAILLLIVGIGLALTPGLPSLELAPELVLLLVLPPLIYSAAVAMSWNDFRFNLRPIALLAIGCVVFTTIATAAATHYLLGFPWAVGFVLGAIVSPPDAVAALSIARRMGLPRRLTVILEGEALANDATALILYRFAVAAVSVGTFSLGQAVGAFALILVGEILWGIAVGWIMLRLRHWVRDPSVEILLSVLTPFLAYWPPVQLGGSGVLATVATGLYFSWNGPRLISAATRLQGIFFWDFLIYLIEGMVFLITGLQARALISGIEGLPLTALASAAAIVCATIIVARYVWIYPATYVPRWMFAKLRAIDPYPPLQYPTVLGSAGIRGIVSLAAALALPATIANGAPFPHRDLILFLTFSVIFVTLVVQGSLLPAIIRWLGLANTGRQERSDELSQELIARRRAIEVASERLERLSAERQLPHDTLALLRAHHQDRLTRLSLRGTSANDGGAIAQLNSEVELALVAAERTFINDLYRAGDLKDDARRRIERELDLREAHLANQNPED